MRRILLPVTIAAMIMVTVPPTVADHTSPDGPGECFDPAARDVADARGHDVVCVDVPDLEPYSPAILQVDPGTTVVWRNVGNLVHTVTFTLSSSGATFDASLAPGDHVWYTFEQEGTAVYHCRINALHTATMHGGVQVGSPA